MIKINFNSTLKSGKFSSEYSHVDRQLSNDSNTTIDYSKSRYNRGFQLMKPWPVINRFYGPYFEKHDRRTKRKDRRFGSPRHYFSIRKSEPTEIGIATLGTLRDKSKLKPKLVSKYGEKGFADRINKGFLAGVRDYNRHNHFSKIYAGMTNLDEKGAPHLHYGLICLGHKKNGTPSPSFSNALADEYRAYDDRLKPKIKANPQKYEKVAKARYPNQIIRKLNMKHFHKITDNMFLKHIGHALGLDFQLQRTGQRGSRPMWTYKRQMKSLDEQKSSVASTCNFMISSCESHITSDMSSSASMASSISTSVSSADTSLDSRISAVRSFSSAVDLSSRSINSSAHSASYSVDVRSESVVIDSKAVSESASRVDSTSSTINEDIGGLKSVYIRAYPNRQKSVNKLSNNEFLRGLGEFEDNLVDAFNYVNSRVRKAKRDIKDFTRSCADRFFDKPFANEEARQNKLRNTYEKSSVHNTSVASDFDAGLNKIINGDSGNSSGSDMDGPNL